MVNFVHGELRNMSLNTLWQHYDIDFTFQSAADENSRSVLDHFYVPQSLVLSCIDAGVIHHVHNTSDHSLIYAKFKYNSNDRHAVKVIHKERTVWHKASHVDINNYHTDLKNHLCNIDVPYIHLYI